MFVPVAKCFLPLFVPRLYQCVVFLIVKFYAPCAVGCMTEHKDLIGGVRGFFEC